jgi:hypothetical protein
MALVDENAKMKRLLFIFSIVAVSGIAVNGQSPRGVGPARGGEIVFGNGARMVRQGDGAVITYGGRSFFVSRKNTPPPPVGTNLNCAQCKSTLDKRKKLDGVWRSYSVWYMENCL